MSDLRRDRGMAFIKLLLKCLESCWLDPQMVGFGVMRWVKRRGGNKAWVDNAVAWIKGAPMKGVTAVRRAEALEAITENSPHNLVDSGHPETRLISSSSLLH